MTSPARFIRLAWFTLALTMFVILWGAFVRASGSGAGCGDHWPLCNGEVIPQAPAMATVIEFTHRLTSGVLGLLVLALVVQAFRTFPARSGLRGPAVLVGVFTLTEALVGAGLVLFQYVAYNVSLARAFWMGAHLLNTLLLLGALAVLLHRALQWRTSPATPPGPLAPSRLRGLTIVTVLGFVILGCSGAVTALGDTLALSGDPAVIEHPLLPTLVGLRVYHPLLAIAVSLLVLGVAVATRRALPASSAARLAVYVLGLCGVQLVLGYVNVLLLAPVWLQLVHLLVTDAIWMLLIVVADQFGVFPSAQRSGLHRQAAAM